MTEKIKITLHYTVKSFIAICFILIVVPFLISWGDDPNMAPVEREESNIQQIYKSTTFEPETKTFYKRDDVNYIVEEIYNQAYDIYNREIRNYIITNIIIEEAVKQSVPVNLAFAIAKTESNFDPAAINHNHTSTDYGLFQLNNSYRNWNRKDFFDIRKNTQEGIRYLKEMMDLFEGDVLSAVAAYNCGPNRVLNNKIPEGTEMYTAKVLAAEDEFNILFNNYLKENNISIVLNKQEDG